MRKHAFVASLLGVITLHVLLVMHFLPPGLVFSSTPLAGNDYEFHAVEVTTFLSSIGDWGHSWSWSPALLAGYPEGTIFDCDSKGMELFVLVLHRLGSPMGLAFNLYVLAAHLALVPVLYGAARLMGLDRWACLAATGMAVLMWHFDADTHLTWRLGTISYAAVGYAGLLPLAALYAYLRSGRWAHLAVLWVSLPVVHLVHPFVFNGLLVPMAFMYLASSRRLRPVQHGAVALAVLVTLVVNSWWMVVLFGFWGQMMSVQTPWQGTLGHLPIDLLGTPGGGTIGHLWGARSGFAILVIAMAGTGLFAMARSRDDRFGPLAAGIGVLLAAAYLGQWVPGLEQTQAYRHIIPALMLCTIPAGVAILEMVRRWQAARQGALPRRAGVFACIVLAILCAREVVFFFPGVVRGAGPTLNGAVPGQSGACLHVPHRRSRFRHLPLPGQFAVIEKHVRGLDPEQGRILIDAWDLAEHVAWTTPVEVMGGFPFRNVVHSRANLSNRMRQGALGVQEFQRYLRDYAVRWVILSRPRPDLASILHRTGTVPGNPAGKPCTYTLYRTLEEASFFAENDGQVSASLNRIDVSGTDPAVDVVLRYHHLETFQCRPGCTFRREPLEGDPVGFIRIPAPHPADFSLVNIY